MEKQQLNIHLQQLLSKHQLQHKRFLLAVSGGVDSMLLLDVFLNLRLDFKVAHANFQLRGEASDADEDLVKKICNRHHIELFTNRFDVQAYQQIGNYSVEMACRNLRYNWFEELLQREQLEVLVTAHHLNDQLETFFINLSRGSGIKGLGVMQTYQHAIFRPFLTLSRDQIEQLAQALDVEWREDETNLTNDYLRNYIRHEISPKLDELHPTFLSNFQKSVRHLQDDYQLILQQIESVKTQLFNTGNDEVIKINIAQLKALQPRKAYLHYLFKEYDFEAKAIEKLFDASTGAELSNSKFRLLRDRDFLLLAPKKQDFWKELTFHVSENPYYCANFVFQKSKNHPLYWDETLDADLIQSPLTLREIIPGDTFYPLGMTRKKKISKFLKDEKVSKFDKEKVKILVDAEGKVLWVATYRIDNRFKISENTNNFLNIKLC